MAVMEWVSDNIDKIITAVVTVVGAVWVAARRFTGRVDVLESDVRTLKSEVAALKKGQSDLENTIMGSLNKIEERFREVLELKIAVERQDVLLKTIHEDLKDLRDDVKRLMRND